MWLGVCVCVWVCERERKREKRGVLVFTWHQERKWRRSWELQILHRCRNKEREEEKQEGGMRQENQRETNEWSVSAGSSTNCRNDSVFVGWASLDYKMCLPSSLTLKPVTQAFVCPDLLGPDLSQPPWLLSTVIMSLASCRRAQSRADSNFLGRQTIFITAWVMDTPQIFPQQTPGFLRDGGEDMGRWVWKQLIKGPMRRGSGEREIHPKLNDLMSGFRGSNIVKMYKQEPTVAPSPFHHI